MGLAELILAGLLWGASFPIIKYGINIGIDTSWLVLLRFSVTAVVCLFLLLLFGGMKRLARVAFYKPFWIVGGLNGMAFVLQYHGLLYTSASKASLLINMNVVFVAALGVYMLKERLSKRVAGAIVLALVGIFLLTTEGDLGNLTGGSRSGDAFQVAAAMVWAFYIIENKKLVDSGRDPLDITAGMLLATFLISIPYSLYRLASAPSAFPSDQLLAGVCIVLYTALGGTLAAYFLYARGVKHVPAVVSAVFLTFEVVTAMTLAFIFLGERLAAIGMLGAVVVCAAIFVVSLDNKEEKIDKRAGMCRNGKRYISNDR